MYFLKKFLICDVWFFSLLVLCLGLLAYSVFNFNNWGVFYIHQKQYKKAQGYFLKNLNNNVFSPLPRMNLAFSYGAGGEFKKSLQEYGTTRLFMEESKNPSSLPADDILFYTFFNSAVGAAQQKRPREALNFYQQALRFKPQSLKVKTNMELLLKTPPPQDKNSKNQESKNSNSQKKPSDSSDQKSSSTEKQPQPKPSPESKQNQSVRENAPLKGEENKSLTPGQVEAILKAIEEQEKQIRKKRVKKPPSLKPSQGKDW